LNKECKYDNANSIDVNISPATTSTLTLGGGVGGSVGGDVVGVLVGAGVIKPVNT